MDPLLSLREAIIAKKPITYAKDGELKNLLGDATHIVISPSLSVPKTTPTRFKKAGTDSVYNLDAIYFAYSVKSAGSADYMKQTRENGLAVGFVSVTERKAVVDWLEGNAPVEALNGATTTPPGTPKAKQEPLPEATDVSSPSKRRYVPDSHDVEIVKRIKMNEIELRDRNTVLRGIKATDFKPIRESFSARLRLAKDAGRSSTSTPAPPAADPKIPVKKRHAYPIIMISSSPTALITMWNVKKFLQEAIFETSQAARERATAEGNTRPDDMIPIYRKLTHIDSSGKETIIHARYFVVDSVEALQKFGVDAWERVVCVMTTGQAWQFRPYKWNEPRILFHHVKGIYVSWANDPPNHKIKDWNVTELKIDQNRRHVDKSVVAGFWKVLDTWTMSNKPSLMKT